MQSVRLTRDLVGLFLKKEEAEDLVEWLEKQETAVPDVIHNIIAKLNMLWDVREREKEPCSICYGKGYVGHHHDPCTECRGNGYYD